MLINIQLLVADTCIVSVLVQPTGQVGEHVPLAPEPEHPLN